MYSSGFPGQVGDTPKMKLNKNVIDIHIIVVEVFLQESFLDRAKIQACNIYKIFGSV